MKIIKYIALCLVMMHHFCSFGQKNESHFGQLITDSLQRIQKTKVQPPGWYSGDIHVHINCGDSAHIFRYDTLAAMMESNDLSVISVLADMGNGEVINPKLDLPKVNGHDAPQSKHGRIIHWDAEWHWDATYQNFSNQALGGHIVLLGLNGANQKWEESPYKILEWGRKQNAVSGFAHLQYLSGAIPDTLNCCIPVDLPVEAALGTVDFASFDVYSSLSANYGNYYSSPAMEVYYKLLNCGIRLGLAAGTDFPCNNFEPLGTLLTYSFVEDSLTYRKWIDAIREGRTVISRVGNKEFLDMKIDGKFIPGAEIKWKQKNVTTIDATWNSTIEQLGTVELLCNGKVIGSVSGNASPGKPLTIKVTMPIEKSCWIAARTMIGGEYQSHTSPVYISVAGKPVKGDKNDARYFVNWIDTLLKNTSPGGKWVHFFPKTLNTIRERYQKARAYFYNILKQ